MSLLCSTPPQLPISLRMKCMVLFMVGKALCDLAYGLSSLSLFSLTVFPPDTCMDQSRLLLGLFKLHFISSLS